jgi:hypothetical protein
MKTKPILFSTPMIQAILAGNKTMTRRICKPQPDTRGLRFTNRWEDYHGNKVKPRYEIGDVLWVRETWQKFLIEGGGFGYTYKANNHIFDQDTKWKPSIFMPKSACRIWLKVTDVKAERLQDISEGDAIMEGVGSGFQMNAGWPDYEHIENGICTLTQDTAKMSYVSLWNKINGKDSWDLNPWVWVYSFERIDKPENF